MRKLQEVTTTLQVAEVSLKLSKCKLFSDTVMYLQHVFKPRNVSVDDVRVRRLAQRHHPRTITELLSFLEL